MKAFRLCTYFYTRRTDCTTTRTSTTFRPIRLDQRQGYPVCRQDLAEVMIQTAEQFFRGMCPQSMDLINKNAFIKECIVVPFEE